MTTPHTQAPLGLIVPPANGEVPYDGAILYPGTRFIARGLGLPSVSPEGYDQVIDAVTHVAKQLASDGAAAISLMGTSLSFYRGVAFNQHLLTAMHQATGLPCTTMSQAVLNGLAALKVQRVVVATAYITDVNQRLATFLTDSGIQVNGVRGLEMTDIAAIQALNTEALVALCQQAWDAFGPAEGIVLSCGGLKTLATIQAVEQTLGVPVISSSPAGFWDLMRTAGRNSRTAGHGRLVAV